MDIEAMYEEYTNKFDYLFGENVDRTQILVSANDFANILDNNFKDILRQEKISNIENKIYYKIILFVQKFLYLDYNEDSIENMLKIYDVVRNFVGKYRELNYYLYDSLEEIDIENLDKLKEYMCLYILLEKVYVKDFATLRTYCQTLEDGLGSHYRIAEFNENNLLIDKLKILIEDKLNKIKGEEENVRTISKHN